MIGRPTGDGTLRFGKAVPRTLSIILGCDLAPTRPQTTMSPPRPAARQLDPYSCFHALVSAFRFAQRPASDPKGSRGELYGKGLEPRKLIRDDHSNFAL